MTSVGAVDKYCCYKLNVKMLVKIFLISFALIFVASKATDYEEKTDVIDEIEEKKDVVAQTNGNGSDGDDGGKEERVEDVAGAADGDAEEKKIDLKSIREDLEEKVEAKYDTLVKDYNTAMGFPPTKECKPKFSQKLKLVALKISGCMKQFSRRNNKKRLIRSCFIKKGIPLTMTAAFDVDESVSELDISKIHFKVEGAIKFFFELWQESPFYTRTNLCTDESLKQLGCMWKKNKLVLRIKMDAVPRYIPISSVPTRVTMFYKETEKVSCFKLNINLV